MNYQLIKKTTLLLAVCLLAFSQAYAQDVPKPLPMKPGMTEFWEPEIDVVTPGEQTDNAFISAPSDAIVLFDGKNLSEWEHADGSDAKWTVADGAFTVNKGTGDIKTKKEFEDFQLHLEFRIPEDITGKSQARGNSGIFLQERYEVQVLDNYNNRTYANGQVGSIYKQSRPLKNPMRAPGSWNVYDIIYAAPRFKEDGSLFSRATVTVILNGVVVQNHTTILGNTMYIGLPDYEAHGPASIRLQDHGDPSEPISFRNIWIREM
ncbi:3-keto-disaccharide hydrolase [Flavilitoribacter nigricans]|uniref:3-keto-alpha-glucoside-1,2-lyase/3-keto-2-hydroxy-glucal hydratase domain-containing protein n=1 Tax=Flavilitoribacter nigricans (strain ATCC 23147 / DSM 23189 / NBRC 102662 / NCIMB 1420 / SS-2) TaxID=1122177 RepID=A0A2D0NCZ4_FLAN2|nr:DUF1080 domain-containing protein [Flavilitoribacter nigricans]PHN06240.1 hypothetical protein CRP01_11715 [Flavilitoribacter nigricans DSM 23189 = NBRC 102662]